VGGWKSAMTSKDRWWVAGKLAKFVGMSKPLGEILDTVARYAHDELSRWCGGAITLRKLRGRTWRPPSALMRNV
jgi:hypothetical protein